MIPLVGTATELKLLGDRVREVIEDVKKDKKFSGQAEYFGRHNDRDSSRCFDRRTKWANRADFFSFGTNDLTQMTFGYSRDDINTFLPDYLSEEILPRDPFESLDTAGVGQLVEMGVRKGRSVKKKLKCGICGEHGGDPDSIQFCHQVGLDYVSCSPFRVPIARLAAAQAALANGK